MNGTQSCAEVDEDRLIAIIADCMERRDRGQSVDRSALLRQHADLAAALQEYFDNNDLVEGLASSIRLEQSAAESASLAVASRTTDATGQAPRTQATRRPPERAVPAEIGRYQIVEALGHGGMGTVYLAHDTNLNRKVALKLPRLDVTDAQESKARFLVEAQAAAQVHHRHICRIYDYGEIDNNTPYYTMEFIEGETLAERIGDDGFAEFAEAVSLIITLAKAMHYPHQLGILHRDLKPANIILDEQGEPVIVDFGLAHDFRTESDSRITQTGVIVGTVGYASPEQIAGARAQLGPGIDIWSLGVILHELLTGRLPFRGTRTDIIAQILRDPAPAPSQLRPDVPPDLDAICLKMLAHDPEDRYTSMHEVSDELEAYLRLPRSPSTTTSIGLVDLEYTTDALPASAAVARSERVQASTDSRNRNRRAGIIAFVVLLGLAVALTAITVTVRRGTEVVTIELSEDLADDVTLSVDGETIDVQSNTVKCRLDRGEHEWVLTHADGTVITAERFSVQRDGRNVFQVSISTSSATQPPHPVLQLPVTAEPQLEWQLPGQRGGVHGGMEFLTNQNVLAVGREHSIQFWDPSTKTLLQTLAIGEANPFTSFDVHPNSQDIVVGGPLKVFTVNRETGIRREVVSRKQRVSAPVKYSPDGLWLAFAHDRDTITLAKADTLEHVHTLPVLPSRAGLIEFSPDSKTLAAASQGASVVLFDVASGDMRENIETEAGELSQIAFHQNGHLLALAGGNTNIGHRVQLWDLQRNAQLRSLNGHADRIDTLTFSPNGSLIATGSQDNTFRLWSTKIGEELYKRAQTTGIDFVDFDHSGRLLAVAAGPGVSGFRLPEMVPLADADPGLYATLVGHLGKVRTLTFSSGGAVLYSAGGDTGGNVAFVDSNVRVWNLDTLQLTKTIESRVTQIRKLRLSSDDSTLAAFGDNRTFQFWNTSTGDRLHDFDGAGFGVIGDSRTDDFDFLPNRQLILVGPEGHAIVDAVSLETVSHWPSPDGRLLRVAAVAESDQILSGALMSGAFRLWNWASESELASFTAPGDNTVDTLAVTPDGRYAVSGSHSEYTVWDITERRLLHTWLKSKSGSAFVRSVAAITPDGSYVLLASRGRDGDRLVLFDVRTGNEIRTFAGHANTINAIAVFTDGQFAATGSDDHTVRLWKLPPPPNPDRVAANWVLSIGGSVALENVVGFIHDSAELPDEQFAISGIELAGNNHVTDDGLAALDRLSHLIELRLTDTPVTDAGLRHLSDLGQLRILHLTGTQVTGPGFAHLKNLSVLRHLYLNRCPLNNDALSLLTELRNLRLLSLYNTSITDAALRPLTDVPLLSELNLGKTRVTDGSIEVIVRMRSLSLLECPRSGITVAGVQQLAQQRPDITCEIAD